MRESCILLFDGEPQVRARMRFAFRKQGLKTVGAGPGEDALRGLEGGDFDVDLVRLRLSIAST